MSCFFDALSSCLYGSPTPSEPPPSTPKPLSAPPPRPPKKDASLTTRTTSLTPPLTSATASTSSVSTDTSFQCVNLRIHGNFLSVFYQGLSLKATSERVMELAGTIQCSCAITGKVNAGKSFLAKKL